MNEEVVTIDQLKSDLEGKFELLCFEDLADYYRSHQLIFNLFKSQYRSDFFKNQRFVFYTSYRLEQDFINHLQRAVKKYNIGNFFILIISPFDLDQELKISNNLLYHDHPISFQVVNLETTKPFANSKFIKNYDSFCPLPFMHFSMSTTGNQLVSSVCCKIGIDEFKVDRLDESIVEIFNQQHFNKLRDNFTNGERPPECNICWDSEKKRTVSLRIQSNNEFEKIIDHGCFDSPKIKVLNLSPSQVCNFNCRICSFYSSSKIAIEELKYTTDNVKRNTILNLLDGNKINYLPTIDKIVESSKNLECLHLLGGEPFKWKQLPILLQKFIDVGYAKNIHIVLNTNGSSCPTHSISLLKQFKSVEILLSIDDIETRFEIQRGSTWDKIVKNLHQFALHKSPAFDVKVTPTVNIQNLLYLDQLVKFCYDVNLDVVWSYLENPEFLCIDNVTKKVKDLVQEKYSNHPNSELQAIAYRVQQSPEVSGKKFIEYMLMLDGRRNQNFKLFHKEIFDAMTD